VSASELSYANDHRVRALDRDEDWVSFDAKAMTLTYRMEDDDGLEEEIVLPARFEVCPTCSGKGAHVNPSIDAHGISREEFDEDPDFRDDYLSGAYDVACYGCGGKRVVPEVNDENLSEEGKAMLARVQARDEREARYRAQQRHEQAMGY